MVDTAALRQMCEDLQDLHAYFSPMLGPRESRKHDQNCLQALPVQSQDRRSAEHLSESVAVSVLGSAPAIGCNRRHPC